jgi:nucleotide-binding universal stress UspA family protein
MIERRPLGNVLVGTDFSAMATNAVERAATLPLGRGGILTIVHVLRVGSDPDERERAERELRHAVATAKDAAARVGRGTLDVFPRLIDGEPSVEIVRAAREGRNELIVVGRHGDGTVAELLLGSTAERIARKGDTSVLIVARRPVGAYRQPLVAVDFSPESQRAVDVAWRVADATEVEVVHAYDLQQYSTVRRMSVIGEAARQVHVEARRQAEAAVASFLAADGSRLPVHVIVREGDPRRAILDTAAQHRCDLLALGTRGRSAVAQVLMGGVAEGIGRRADCDVLLARGAP